MTTAVTPLINTARLVALFLLLMVTGLYAGLHFSGMMNLILLCIGCPHAVFA